MSYQPREKKRARPIVYSPVLRSRWLWGLYAKCVDGNQIWESYLWGALVRCRGAPKVVFLDGGAAVGPALSAGDTAAFAAIGGSLDFAQGSTRATINTYATDTGPR